MRTKVRLIVDAIVHLPLVALTLMLSQGAPAFAASADPALMTPPASATMKQTQPALPLSAVFDESLVNSPRAATIRAQLGISRAALAQAWTLPNPSFFFLDDTAQLARQVGGSMPIEPPWKLAFRLLLAKAQIRQTDLEIAKNLWQLRGVVRRAYLDAVMATETAETYTELSDLAESLKMVAQKRFAASDVAALDVNRAELATLQAEADVLQSKRRIQQTTQRLTVILGRNYSDTVQVMRLPKFELHATTHELLPNFQEPLPSLDALVGQALSNRLDIKVINQNLVANVSNLRLARANIMPDPVLNAGSSYSGNPPKPSIATKGFYIAVTQEIPILNHQQGELARLKAVRNQLMRELNSTRNQVTEEVVIAYQQVAAARERIALFQTKILPASNKVAKMARLGYEFGQTDITATLAAQQANVQNRASYLESVRLYQQSLTDLEQAIGRPL